MLVMLRQYIIKNPVTSCYWVSYGAAIQIRTGDLVLTKDALCLLSYSSGWRPGRGSNPRPLA